MPGLMMEHRICNHSERYVRINGMTARNFFSITFLLIIVAVAVGQPQPPSLKASKGIEQLRQIVGNWDVTTEILFPDGTVELKQEGSWQFRWVVPDRVLSGESHQAESKAAILIYVHAQKEVIELATVGEDGLLWVMSGAADSESLTTPNTKVSEKETIMFRWSRYEFEKNRFRSKLEISKDGGKTWVLRHRQEFRRKSASSNSTQTGK